MELSKDMYAAEHVLPGVLFVLDLLDHVTVGIDSVKLSEDVT